MLRLASSRHSNDAVCSYTHHCLQAQGTDKVFFVAVGADQYYKGRRFQAWVLMSLGIVRLVTDWLHHPSARSVPTNNRRDGNGPRRWARLEGTLGSRC